MTGSRTVIWILGLCCALVALSGAWGAGSGEAGKPAPAAGATAEGPAPFYKYAEPVEVTTCRILTSWMGMDPGEDENNNWWSRTYLEQLNIKLNVVWTSPNWGEPYDQKLATSLATDDLPDIMVVGNNWAMKMLKGGKLTDVTDVYNKYASAEIKDFMTRFNGLPLKNCTQNGRMFGIADPGSLDTTETPKLIWIRSDWMAKLGLKTPKTLEDVEAIARAFVTKDPDGDGSADTYGIAFDKDVGQVWYLCNAYGAHPGLYGGGWMEVGGSLQYGSIHAGTRDALKRAAKWYKESLLAKDFSAKDDANDVTADVSSGKVGIVLGGPNSPNGGALRALKRNEPSSDWIWIPLPTAEGGEVLSDALSRCDGYTVVSYKCKYPEAVMKLINLKVAAFGPDKPSFVVDSQFDTTKGGNMSWWNSIVGGTNLDRSRDQALAKKVLKENGDPSTLPAEARISYDMLKSWRDEGVNGKDFDLNWSIEKLVNYGGTHEYSRMLAKENRGFYYDRFWGPDTPAMIKYGNDWGAKRIEYFTKAIMNGNVDEEFDAWVKYWKANGGDEATKEANEWYAANK